MRYFPKKNYFLFSNPWQFQQKSVYLRPYIYSDCNFDLCKFPKEDEEILPPAELLADYFKKRKALDHEIDKTLAEIQRILGIDVKVDEL